MSRPPNAAASSKSAWLQQSGSGSASMSAGKPNASAMAAKSSGWSAAKTTSTSGAKSAWSAPTYSAASGSGSGSTAKSSWTSPGSGSGSAAAKSPWYAPTGSGSSSAIKYSSASSASSPWAKSNAIVPLATKSSLSSTSAAYGQTKAGQSAIGAFGKSAATSSSSAAWSSSKSGQQTSTTSSVQSQLKSGSFMATKTSSTSTSKTYSAKEQFYAQQHHASSINKNVMDKATNLMLYKSPDLLAARHGTGLAGSRAGLIGSVAGTKYYQPVYGRSSADQMAGGTGTGMGGGSGIGSSLIRAGPAAALATAVLHQANSESAGGVGGRPLIGMMPIAMVAKTPVANIGAVAKSTDADEVTKQQQQQQKLSVLGEKAKPIEVAKPLARVHSKPGYLIIFNQQDFRMPGVQRRAGSQKDEEALCRTFYEFGFDPHVKRNLKLKEMDKVAKDLYTKDFRKYACCVVVILSHGHQNETIYAADGSFKLQSMLVDRVAMNSTLQGKAKIFIVAACKGDSEDVIVPPMAARMQTDAQPIGGAIKQLPYMRDTLKCYSTYEGFVSYRDPERGTVFVQELCRSLREHGHRMHVEDVLKQVNVALTERTHQQQVPSVVSTMSFNICLGDLKH